MHKDAPSLLRQFHKMTINIEESAAFHHFIYANKGTFSRYQNHVLLNKPHSSYRAHSLTRAYSGVHDIVYDIHHVKPDTYSEMHNRALLGGNAEGIFMAKTTIQENATNSESHQQSKAFLTSTQAKMHAKPELDIRHDQVIASHGSAIGELDGNQLFYLMSRGIEKEIATNILAEGLLIEPMSKSIRNLKEHPLFIRWLELCHLSGAFHAIDH